MTYEWGEPQKTPLLRHIRYGKSPLAVDSSSPPLDDVAYS